MAKGMGGARQPLARQRPKVAAGKKALGRVGAAPTKKRTTGGPPPKTKVPPKPKTSATIPSPTLTKSRKAAAGPAAKRRPIKQLSGQALTAHATAVWDHLAALYPDAHCELDFRSPWELLVATILSAQCTDKRVNMVTPHLFATYPTPAALAAATPQAVEEIIKSTGFFRAKAKSILGAAAAITDRHQGKVPPRMEDLVVLPGVGRKTANVVLGNAFDINHGVVVDTHVGRLAIRLGLTSETDPVKVEQRLMQAFPQERWTLLSHLLIWHGRRVCDARKPRCGDCSLRHICPSSLV